MNPSHAQPARLRRRVGLLGLVLYGLGTTVGAGVYALMGVVAGRAGMAAPVAFAVAAGLAGLTALSFAELSARHPRAGGEAVYVAEGFGVRGLGSAVGVLVCVAGALSAATVCSAFVGYLGQWVEVPRVPALLGVLAAVGAIAGWGVRQVVLAASLMTLVEIGGLLLVMGAAGEHWLDLPARAHEIWPGLGGDAWLGVLTASVVAFYAFLGFEDMVNVAEEVRDVRRTLPRAILLTLGATLFLYIGTSLAAILVVDPAELSRSDAPLALVFERSGAPPRWLGAIALFAMLNGALVQVTKVARVLYGLGSMGTLSTVPLLGRLAQRVARVDPRTRTPLTATVLVTIGVAVMGLALPLHELAIATSSITLVVFALANLALLWMKRRDPVPRDGFRVPAFVPALGFLLSSGFALSRLILRHSPA